MSLLFNITALSKRVLSLNIRANKSITKIFTPSQTRIHLSRYATRKQALKDLKTMNTSPSIIEEEEEDPWKEPETHEEVIEEIFAMQPKYDDKKLMEMKSSKVMTVAEDPYEEQKNMQRVQASLFAPMYGNVVEKKSKPYHHVDLKTFFARPGLDVKKLNDFILGCVMNGRHEDSYKAFEIGIAKGIDPDVHIYTTLMKGCVLRKSGVEAEMLFEQMVMEGVNPDVWTIDTLIEAYIAEGNLEKAYSCYDYLKKYNLEPNAPIFTSLIKGCIKISKDTTRAWKTYEHMKVWHCKPDEVLMTMLIQSCATEGLAEKAVNLFAEMKEMGLRPTDVTYFCLLHVFSKRKDYYEEAFNIIKEMRVDGYSPTVKHLACILNICAKSADIDTAELIFDEIMANREYSDVTEYVYTFMIEAYSNSGKNRKYYTRTRDMVKNGEKVFQMMLDHGIKPTVVSYNQKLALYTRHALINRALEWREQYKKDNIQPDEFSFNCLIEMYGRTRRMDNALDVYNLMKAEGIKPNFTTYSFLMNGCTKNHFYNTGIKLLKEMYDNGFVLDERYTFIVNFRRMLVKWPDMVREIDHMTGKAYADVLPWRRPGRRKKITYHRELTKEEKARSSLYG